MMLRPRLLPSVILAAAALLGVKLVDLWSSGNAVIVAALAQSAAAPQPAAPDAPQAPPASPPAPAAAPIPAPVTASASAPNKPAPAAQAEKAPDPLQMSPQEVDELQQLAQRRVELDKRGDELREREVLMQATEKRIDEKIAKLQSLENSIAGSVKQQNSQDQARVQSLANMYQQMKPEQAARILDQLDVPVVLDLLSLMREMKAAPILAAMDPAKAKAVTIALTQAKSGPAAALAGGAPTTGPAATSQE